MKSLQSRLNSRMVSLLCITFFLQWLLFDQVIRHVADEYVLVRLQNDAESILAQLDKIDDKWVLPDKQHADIYLKPFSGFYFQARVNNQKFSSRSTWDYPLSTRSANTGAAIIHFASGPLNQQLMIRDAAYTKMGDKVEIATAQDISDLEEDITQAMWAFIGLTFVALLILYTLQNFTVRRGLKPVTVASNQLHAMQTGELSRLDANVPQEIQPLVVEINHLVEQLDERLKRSRNAMGNLAHSYKAPLTVLGQLTQDPLLDSSKELKDTLKKQLQLLTEITERELKKARVAGQYISTRRFDPETDIQSLLDMFNKIYQEKSLTTHLRIDPDIRCYYDREDMLELFGNLIDNAYKWATSSVDIQISSSGQAITFSIQDDGPGVSEQELENIIQRGIRIDENTLGHGLGLAMVKEIVKQYKGQLNFQKVTENSGFKVTIDIPLSQTSS